MPPRKHQTPQHSHRATMHAADIISLRNLRESSRIIKIQIIYFLVVAGYVPLVNSLFYVVQSSRMLGYLLVVLVPSMGARWWRRDRILSGKQLSVEKPAPIAEVWRWAVLGMGACRQASATLLKPSH